MPDIDEDIMRGLMTHATGDIFAPPAATAAAIRRQRQRRMRGRMLGVAGTAAAAGLAAATIITTNGRAPASSPVGTTAPGGSAHGGTALPPAHLTAAQQTLFGLSNAAAAAKRPAGRYSVMTEQSVSSGSDGGSVAGQKTSVIDTRTGGGVEYQNLMVKGEQGQPQPPAVLPIASGTFSTAAQLDAMPTDPGKLRAQLLAQAQQQNALVPTPAGKPGAQSAQPQLSDDDLVFEQAADMLWQPDLGPALRSALYKVMAATPGVKVQTGAHDSSGRPAVEVSRMDSLGQTDVQTYEDPKTGAVLESAWVEAGFGPMEDLYQSIKYTDSIPANPYQS